MIGRHNGTSLKVAVFSGNYNYVKDGANQAEDPTDLVSSTTARVSRFAILEQNPTGTPAAWTRAALQTIAFGPKNAI